MGAPRAGMYYDDENYIKTRAASRRTSPEPQLPTSLPSEWLSLAEGYCGRRSRMVGPLTIPSAPKDEDRVIVIRKIPLSTQ